MHGMVMARKRVTIWLGDAEGNAETIENWSIHSEDSMVAVEGTMEDGSEIEVFIGPGLFGRIREVMDGLERA
jgi:hypothetical protein